MQCPWTCEQRILKCPNIRFKYPDYQTKLKLDICSRTFCVSCNTKNLSWWTSLCNLIKFISLSSHTSSCTDNTLWFLQVLIGRMAFSPLPRLRTASKPDDFIEYSTGASYKGKLDGKKRKGSGTFYWPNAAKYEGEFSDNQRQGQGRCLIVYPRPIMINSANLAIAGE